MDSFDAVICDIMRSNVLEELNEFMDMHRDKFATSREIQGSEYTSEQFICYQQFCDILENQVALCCSNQSINPKDFMKVCTSNIDVSPTVDTFAKILLLSTDFQLFDDVMRDTEKSKYMFRLWRDWSNVLVQSVERK